MTDKDGNLTGSVGEKIAATSKGGPKAKKESGGASSKEVTKRKWSSNETWKPSATEAVTSLLEKQAKDVTLSDTRKAIKEYKDQFNLALKAAKESDDGITPYEIRLDFDRYHKELASKMLDIEKNGNTKTMEGRVAIKDAQRFLYDGAGCDRSKIAW